MIQEADRRTEATASAEGMSALPVALDRDSFLRKLICELVSTLQDVVGTKEAEGFVSVVGELIGERLDHEYRTALKVERLNRKQVAAALVDLKRRIQGDFFIVEETPDRIVLGNRACPFGDFVRNRPALCMMTSNVFGRIAASNLGYARVDLEETIAMGHPGCRVVIHLKPADAQTGLVRNPEGRVYFGETAEG